MEFYVWDEHITGMTYCDRILITKVIPHIQQHPGPGFIFMDDNAPVHHARVARDALKNATIPRMDWPVNSPNINPIEHLWDMDGRGIKLCDPPIQNLRGLHRAIVEEWNQIPPHKFRHLVQSCHRRCQAVVESHGEYTRY